jgi:hypothetical protein
MTTHTYVFPEWTINYTPNTSLEIVQRPNIIISLPLQPTGTSLIFKEGTNSSGEKYYKLYGLSSTERNHSIAIIKRGSKYTLGLLYSDRRSQKQYNLLAFNFEGENVSVINALIRLCKDISEGNSLPFPFKTPILKNALDAGEIEIPSDQKENAISYDEFVVGENVVLLKEGEHIFYFKAKVLDEYYNALPAGSDLKNPMTNTVIGTKESSYPTNPDITIQVGTVSRLQEGGKSRRKTRKVRKNRKN